MTAMCRIENFRLGNVRIRVCLHWLLAILIVAMPSIRAFAHKDHREREAVEATVPGAYDAPVSDNRAMAQHAQLTGDNIQSEPQSFAERLFDWLGRVHPMLVHFPIAFIPAALFTAIVGRKRPGFAKPVQFMVVTGGLTAPVAAAAGWLDAGISWGADDWMMQSHRWIGTGIGIGAFALAIWAIRRPGSDRGPGMILGLSVLTAAILVQGWFGGALVHGVDHLNW